MKIKVDLDGINDAAASIRRADNRLDNAVSNIDRALDRLRRSPELATYVPGGVLNYADGVRKLQAELREHATALVSFAAAVRKSDTFTADYSLDPNPRHARSGQVDDAAVASFSSMLPTKARKTEFGMARQRNGQWELVGPGGHWYPLDIPRSDADDQGFHIVGQSQGLRYLPDERSTGDRLADAFFTIIGTPSGPFGPAPGANYRHLEIGRDGRPRYDLGIKNKQFGSSDTGFEPADAVPESPPDAGYDMPAGTRDPIETRTTTYADGALALAKGLSAAIVDQEQAYAVNVSLEESRDNGRRGVIQVYTVSDSGYVTEGAVTGFDDDGKAIVSDVDPAAIRPWGEAGDCLGPSAQAPDDRPSTVP